MGTECSISLAHLGLKERWMFRQTILVVSPDHDHSRRLRECLEKAGYRVLVVGLGLSALEMIQNRAPDLVLFDWKLPDLNSLAVIRQIRAGESTMQLPIILKGIEMVEEDLILGLEAGADLCLKEPFHPEVLIARVRALLRRSRA